jgi:predicted NBD/HSP70 family sugar kinase
VNRSLLHLTWGTGVGTALIRRGRPHYGWEGGHLPVTWNEPAEVACGCGSFIDLESRVAVPRIVDHAYRLFETGQYDTKLKKADFKEPREVPKLLSRYARENDDDELSQLDAMAIIAYPDMVTIGGAMMDSDWLLAELRTNITISAQGGFLKESLRPDMVHRAQLGNQAGMIGAAMLALSDSSASVG